MIDPNKKYVTREDKYPARIICTDAGGKYPVVALVEIEGDEIAHNYTTDGRTFASREDDLDLIEVPERVSRWVCLYPPGIGGFSHPSREAAVKAVNSGCLAVLELIYEGDQPVDVKLHPVGGSDE